MDFCLLLKIWVKTLSKNLSGRYSQKLLEATLKISSNVVGDSNDENRKIVFPISCY